jgi:hypothetical protein
MVYRRSYEQKGHPMPLARSVPEPSTCSTHPVRARGIGVKRLVARALAVESDGSRIFRRRRFQACLDLIDRVLADRAVCRIVDIGGEPKYWEDVADMLGSRPIHITLLNRTALEVEGPRFDAVRGDARDLAEYADASFDLAHSNSVIEHVGDWEDMAAMAREVRRIAPLYFVQTPNFWFPVEPHCSTLFFHWVPVPMRVSMLMRRQRGNWSQAPDLSTAMRQIQSNSLLDRRMFATLFPDATIHGEKFLGIVKSWMAIRSSPSDPVMGAV